MRSRGHFRSGAEHAELCSTLDVFGGKRRTVEGLRAQANHPYSTITNTRNPWFDSFGCVKKYRKTVGNDYRNPWNRVTHLIQGTCR